LGDPLDDRELVQKLIAKDPQAERYFFQTYKDKVYQACSYLLGYRDPEAEDTAQEAFIIALRKLPEFEFRSSLNRWLYRICVFLCYERIRKRRRQVTHLDWELDNLSAPLSLQKQRRQEEEEEKARMAGIIRSQRDLMGEPCKDLLRLRDEEDHSYAQLSEALKVPIGTVMSRLSRCKEALKRLVLDALKAGENV